LPTRNQNFNPSKGSKFGQKWSKSSEKYSKFSNLQNLHNYTEKLKRKDEKSQFVKCKFDLNHTKVEYINKKLMFEDQTHKNLDKHKTVLNPEYL
jgi:patatin-like phospholipase/acyl hydrolase